MRLLIVLLFTVICNAQSYGVYIGTVIHEDNANSPGYLIGLEFTVDLHQNRDYLKTLLLGFEHSAFMSNNMVNSYNQDTSSQIVDCNCDSESIGFQGYDYTFKKETRAVSLNLGIEITRKWYLLSGVTNYQHIKKVNNEKVSEYRETYIDAGIKYFIKSKEWYFSPFFKFNPETISFGIGIAR